MLPQAGPARAAAENARRISGELAEASRAMLELGAHMAEYYEQVAETWAGAQKKADARIGRIPDDEERPDAERRVWIDMFDGDFTDLFDSERFGRTYGEMLKKEMEVTRRWGNITSILLESANLPSRRELNELAREVHALKRRISRLEADGRA